MKRGHTHQQDGFTLVEILTAITVVGILLALLIPALSMVQETAMKVKQRTQFHSIEVALETFYTDTGDYPPSKWDTATYGRYTASHRLAEAMVGADGFGFHPDSRFYGDNTANEVLGDLDSDGTLEPVYDVVNGVTASTDNTYDQTAAENVAVRQGPYLELENANAVKLSDLYYGSLNYGNLTDSYVLADQFKITKNQVTGKMTGSPILYFRANTSKVGHTPVLAQLNNNTYNLLDAVGNEAQSDSIVDLPPLSTKIGLHPMSTVAPNDSLDAMERFYNLTKNPNFTSPPRPYRSESFILQSAGPDGLYGTGDDVFNFDRED